jgi:hypothetical protein
VKADVKLFSGIKQIVLEGEEEADAAYGSEARVEIDGGRNRLTGDDLPMAGEACLVEEGRSGCTTSDDE